MCPVRSKGKGRKTADPLRLTPYGFFGTGRGGLTRSDSGKKPRSISPFGRISSRARNLSESLRRAELGQGVLLVVFVNHFHRHADRYLIHRAVDHITDEARSLVEIDQRHVVRRFAFVGRMPGAVVVYEGIYFALAAELRPGVVGGQTVRTGALRREAKKLAAGVAALCR